jgi:hypothetical protein
MSAAIGIEIPSTADDALSRIYAALIIAVSSASSRIDKSPATNSGEHHDYRKTRPWPHSQRPQRIRGADLLAGCATGHEVIGPLCLRLDRASACTRQLAPLDKRAEMLAKVHKGRSCSAVNDRGASVMPGARHGN